MNNNNVVKLDYNSRGEVYRRLLDMAAEDGDKQLERTQATVRKVDRAARQFIGDLPLWKYRISRLCYPQQPLLRHLLMNMNQLTFTDSVIPLNCYDQLIKAMDPQNEIWQSIPRTVRTIPDIHRFIWLVRPRSQYELKVILFSLSFTRHTLRSLIIRPEFDFESIVPADQQRSRIEGAFLKSLLDLPVDTMQSLELNHRVLTRMFYHHLHFYWDIVKRLTGLQDLCVHGILDNFDELDWIDVAAETLADKRLQSLSLHWEMRLSAERASRLTERVLLPQSDSLKYLIVQGPGAGLILSALGDRISQFRNLRSFECFGYYSQAAAGDGQPIVVDAADDNYPFNFILGLFSIEHLQRVHLPSLPVGHAPHWRHLLKRSHMAFQLSFTVPESQSQPLQLIWSIGFPRVSAVSLDYTRQFVRTWPGRDPAFEQHFAIAPASLSGITLTENRHLDAVNFDFAELFDFSANEHIVEFTSLDSINLEGVSCDSLVKFAERVLGIPALQKLSIATPMPADCKKWSDNQVTLKLLKHPNLHTLELSFDYYEPFGLLPLLDSLQNTPESRLKRLVVHTKPFAAKNVCAGDYLRVKLLDKLHRSNLQSAEITFGFAFQQLQPELEIFWNRNNGQQQV